MKRSGIEMTTFEEIGDLYEVLKVLNKTKVLLIFAKEISKIINDVFDTSFYI